MLKVRILVTVNTIRKRFESLFQIFPAEFIINRVNLVSYIQFLLVKHFPFNCITFMYDNGNIQN
jgi:hypothetical protein